MLWFRFRQKNALFGGRTETRNLCALRCLNLPTAAEVDFGRFIPRKWHFSDCSINASPICISASGRSVNVVLKSMSKVTFLLILPVNFSFKSKLRQKQLRQYPNTFFSLIFPPLFCWNTRKCVSIRCVFAAYWRKNQRKKSFGPKTFKKRDFSRRQGEVILAYFKPDNEEKAAFWKL